MEILIHDSASEYKKYITENIIPAGDFPHSLIFCPMRKGDKVLGVISLQSFEKNAYTDYHLNIVRTLAHYAVIALENSRHFETMEEEVKVRTKEVVKQKEEIEKSYENTKLLSEIGRDITSQLSVEKINEVVYARINDLMDADGFGIGIYDDAGTLVYPGYIESDEILDVSYDSLDDVNKMGAFCFKNDEEILIGNLKNEYSKYVERYVDPDVGLPVTSLIYLPLKAKDKKIGVITVQSFKAGTYTDYHVNILAHNWCLYCNRAG